MVSGNEFERDVKQITSTNSYTDFSANIVPVTRELSGGITFNNDATLVRGSGTRFTTELKVGDTINFYLPQTSANLDGELYNFFFGQRDPKFLVVKLNQKYTTQVTSYHTIITIVKDSYKDEITTIMKKVADSKGQPSDQ